MQNVVTNQARPFWLGGLSKFAVVPAGAARAGRASRAASSSAESDIVEGSAFNRSIWRLEPGEH